MSTFDAINRAYWDKITPIHKTSSYYEYESFQAGNSTLKAVEEEELGDVAGMSILHLQCHFGLHTLSLERKGAHVVGVDYSEEAIRTATQIRDSSGLKSEFICANVYDLPDLIDRRFDIVFTSYGVLYCLADLDRWARVIAHCLKEDGFFYIVDIHPLMYMLDEDGERLVEPYFHDSKGRFVADKDARVVPGAGFHADFQEWSHSLGEIVTAILNAGMSLEFLHEHPFIVYNARKYLVEDGPSRFKIGGAPHQPPLMFSFKARLAPTSHNVSVRG
jgi:2-polyprenyl-3-methyl-5-hydroxy-6-metoxy-1,4-benzoquinol methylase